MLNRERRISHVVTVVFTVFTRELRQAELQIYIRMTLGVNKFVKIRQHKKRLLSFLFKSNNLISNLDSVFHLFVEPQVHHNHCNQFFSEKKTLDALPSKSKEVTIVRE